MVGPGQTARVEVQYVALLDEDIHHVYFIVAPYPKEPGAGKCEVPNRRRDQRRGAAFHHANPDI